MFETKFYEGKPCRKCGNTKRYEKTRCCVDCMRKYNKRESTIEKKRLSWLKANSDPIRIEKEIQRRKEKLKEPRVIKYRYEWYLQRKDNLPLYFYKLTKNRARNRKQEHTITEKDIVIPEYCPILGLKLESYLGTKVKIVPDNSISVDRLDSSKGYVPGNVCVMSLRANRLKNNATFEEIEKMYNWAKLNLRKKDDCSI